MATPIPRPHIERRTSVATGIRLRRLREALGYPEGRQKSFAEEVLGMRYGTWNKYETGENALPIALALRLKDLCGVPTDWIYDADPRNLPFELSLRLGESFDPEQH